MKGLIAKALAGGLWAVGALAACGCGGEMTYRDIVDPCWPERYNAVARREVNDVTAPQVHNGHVLDQTVWNEYFETGTDKLNVAGQEKLKYIARRRPAPDLVVYVQNAQDVPYDPAKPEDSTARRNELNARRTQAVQNFLSAYTGSGQPFQVAVHDPADVSQLAVGVQRAAQAKSESFQGVLRTFITLGGSGGAGGGGGGGGGGR
jgi:hypothetical protein